MKYFLLSALLVITGSLAAFAQCNINQSASSLSFFGFFGCGESFTPSCSGAIIAVSKSSGSFDPDLIEIRTGGNGTGTVIYSQSAPLMSQGSHILTVPVPVSAGTLYCVLFYRSSGNNGDLYATSNLYPGGNLLALFNNTWQAYTTQDLKFSVSINSNCSNCTSAPSAPSIQVSGTSLTGSTNKYCPGDTITASIANPSPSVCIYNWSAPVGGTILSGQGTSSVSVLLNQLFIVPSIVTVTATNTCGTSALASKTVARGSKPGTPGTITGPNYGVCNINGVPYSVPAVAHVSYTWSSDNPHASISSGQGTASVTANFLPAFAGGYIQVYGGNGCGISAIKKLKLSTLPAKPVNMTGASSVCAGSMNVLYQVDPVYGADSYTWTSPTGSVIFNGAGTFNTNTYTTPYPFVQVNYGSSGGSVKVKANNACGSSGYASMTVTMNCRTIQELELPASINLYPNPARTELHISFTAETEGGYIIRVIDMLGKQVSSRQGQMTTGNNETTLDVSNLAAGVYQLMVEGSGTNYKERFVVE